MSAVCPPTVPDVGRVYAVGSPAVRLPFLMDMRRESRTQVTNFKCTARSGHAPCTLCNESVVDRQMVSLLDSLKHPGTKKVLLNSLKYVTFALLLNWLLDAAATALGEETSWGEP